jgi:hypothetical protein
MRGERVRVLWIPSLLLLVAAGPAVAESRIEKELALAPGGRLVVDADAASVRVAGGTRSGVRVVVTSEHEDLEAAYDLAFEERSGEVGVVARRKRGGDGEGWSLLSFFRGGSRHGIKIEIDVPAESFAAIDTSGGSIDVSGVTLGADLDTSGGAIAASDIGGDLRADTSGGAISIEGVTGNVVADTSGGSIQVENVRGSLRADTSGGSIHVDGVGGDIEAGTSGGSISIEDAGGKVTAETSGGSVTVAFAARNASGGKIAASGGGIRVEIDPGVGLEIDAEASGGSVSSDVPVTARGSASRSELRGTVGAGGNRLELRSSGGGIRIGSL